MTNTINNATTGRWQAEVVTEHRIIPIHETNPQGKTVVKFCKVLVSHVVISKSGTEEARFRVNRRKDRRLTFTDKREQHTGTAGSTGQWGTRPASKPGPRRSLTPTAWKAEVSRLIGSERADEIVRLLNPSSPPFLSRDLTVVRHGDRNGGKSSVLTALQPNPNENARPASWGSHDEASETARVVGYGPGLGSCITREE